MMDIFSTSWGLVEGLGGFSFNAKEANLISRHQLGKWEVAHCCNHEFADSSRYLMIFVVLCHWSRVCLMLSALKNQTKVIYPIFLTVGTRKCSLSFMWMTECLWGVGWFSTVHPVMSPIQDTLWEQLKLERKGEANIWLGVKSSHRWVFT